MEPLVPVSTCDGQTNLLWFTLLVQGGAYGRLTFKELWSPLCDSRISLLLQPHPLWDTSESLSHERVSKGVLSQWVLSFSFQVPLYSSPALRYCSLEMSACAPSPSLPFNFPHLSIVNQRYLVCQSPSSLFLFHSSSYQLVAWTEALDLPEHFYCDGQQLLLLTQGGRGIKVLQFASVNTSVKTLVKLGLDQQACKVRHKAFLSHIIIGSNFFSRG